MKALATAASSGLPALTVPVPTASGQDGLTTHFYGKDPTMPNTEILAALSGIHELLRELLRGVPAADAAAPYDPRLGCLSGQFAQTVYRETYWLREVVAGDADLTARVRHLFAAGSAPAPDAAVCGGLPPPAHLIDWAGEIQAEHLRRLATPDALPAHPLLVDDRLAWYLLQENARAYERMLALLWLRALRRPGDHYQVEMPLAPRLPALDRVEVKQGHYRIGSRGERHADDLELPPQAVELASFRISTRPVSNAEYLAFISDGGYQRRELWEADGLAWLEAAAPRPAAPLGWRQDARGCWYEQHLNGPADLLPDQPVNGINRHEARAFAAWTASLGRDHAGAVVQHEYQWEVAARAGLIDGAGRVWEWCANPLHPYPDFVPFPDSQAVDDVFSRGDGVLRGASLHTQRCLRRASYRSAAAPDSRWGFAGTRLVYPPGSGL